VKLIEHRNGTIVEVFVKPNSTRFEIAAEEDEIVVRCTNEPVKGKVNKELVKELSRFFHAPIEIISGSTSRKKLILIKDVKMCEVENFLLGEIR
jgi:uncharacterized protein (TIGR00251 family)